MFEISEFYFDEVFRFMNLEQAAEFLGLPYPSFREIAHAAEGRYYAGAFRVFAA